MRRRLLDVALALGALAGALGTAPRARAEAEVVRPATAQVSLQAGKGTLIRLDAPANSVFIADPKVADIEVKSPTLIYVTGKAPGETTLFAVDEHNAVLANLDISVRYDEAQLKQDLSRLLPGREITVSAANNGVVLTGTVGSAADGETAKAIAARFVDKDRIVNDLKVDAPNQVNLRVRVAEVSRDIVKAFGFNWESAGAPGNFTFGLATGNPISPGTLVPRGQNNVDNLFASYASGKLDLNALIDALDSEQLVTVLAEPNLTAVSGAEASFLAGGEFPIPVPQSLNEITIVWKQYGVSLSFVATIADGNRINLMVKPEVSELSTDGAITLDNITVPALTTRRAQTTVDLASGQSFAIAGLLQNNVTHTLQKFPGLGNLAVLGPLFRSTRFERNESELVIIVTPYIVRPSSKRLAAPTDGYVAPSDAAMLMKGADYTPHPPGQPAAQKTGTTAPAAAGAAAPATGPAP